MLDRQRDSAVPCPVCGGANLALRSSCLSTRLVCGGCARSFTLEQLAPLLDDEAFARLAEAIGDRLSDRV